MMTCLIAEDSDLDRTILTRSLKKIGYDVVAVDNGESALDYCKDMIPEVMFVDFHMPRMNGMDFVRMLRRLPDGSNPYVVMYSATDDKHVERTQALAMDCGADDYMQKPFTFEMLEQKIEEISGGTAAAG